MSALSCLPIFRLSLCVLFVVFASAAQAQVSITFQGRVMYSTGVPASDVEVIMTITDGGSSSIATTNTDSGGNYTFQSSRNQALPCTRQWHFQAFSNDMVDDEVLPSSNIASSSGCVGPGIVTLGNLSIVRPREITLGGVVKDQFGTPVQSLTITMTRTKYDLTPNVITVTTTTTDANGHYQFSTYSRCSVVEDFRPSIAGYIFQGGTSTSGCVLSDNNSLNFTINLAERENAGRAACNRSVGKPVNVTNGNAYLEQTDYLLPGVGDSILISRSYNSISQVVGLFGRGWTTLYDERVTNANGLLQLTLSDGRLVSATTANFFGQVSQNADGTYAVVFRSGEVHRFNSSGKLTALIDRNGNQTTLVYDGPGRLLTVTDPSGRVLNVTTNGSGVVSSISDSLGTVATYSYGGNQQLLTVTYADSSGYQFAYAPVPAGLVLSSVTDVLGNVIEHHDYDAQGRAITSEAHGGVERYTLNFVSPTETDVTDALGRVTKFFYRNIKGTRVVTEVQGLCGCGSAQVQTWTYDDQLNVTRKTDALNHSINFTYDSNGNRLSQTDATGTMTFTYNAFGQVLTGADQMNNVTRYNYDGAGNVLTTTDALNNTTTFAYNARGQMLTAMNARGKTTTFTYDAMGNLTQRKDANNIITFFFYDVRSRLIKLRDGLSRSTLFAYDLAGRINKVTYPDNSFTSFTYDLAGRRTRVTDERGNPTIYGYDGAYRLTNVTDALNHTASFSYDLTSNLTSVTDALSRVTGYEYDDFNRLRKITYPAAESGANRLFETITYDADSNVTSRTDTAGRETHYGYDDINRLTSTTDAANKTTTLAYDALSRVTSLTDAINQQYQFAYDALGRQIQITRAGLSMSYAYDEVGNRIQRTNYNGAVTNYSYDNLNRLTSIAYPTRTVSFGYDPLNNVTRAANENGTIYLGYDNRYRVSTVSDPFFYGVSYNYDAAGNRTKLKVNGATYATYTYDAINRLTSLADSANLNFIYSYDAVNRLTSRGAPNGVVTSYGYDGLDRLTSLTHTKGATTLSGNLYTYNDANNISSWTTQTAQRTYSYDAVDRLTATANFEMPAENYSYDAVGNRTASQLSASYGYQPFNRLTNTSNASYSYDNSGNLVSKTDALGEWSFVYDEENRLTQVNKPGGLTINYTYDALGRRIQRTTSAGANERYVYDGADALIDLNADWSVATTYLNGLGIDDHLRQTNSNTGISYFLTDHLGSTAAFADISGNAVEQVAYDSFGNSAGSTRSRYGYTGRERDPDTGMLFYRARFYDPQVGRFSSEDPIGLAGGINAYSYTNNNSLTRKDPSGLYDIDVHYYLTYYLAVSTGCFSGAEAREIAEGDQRSDEDEDKKPAWGNKIVWRWGQPIVVANEEQQERNARFHSFGDGYRNSLRANELWGLALKDGGNLGAFGTYHHFRQDSFSHGPYAGNTTWGQTTGGTQVDHTNFDPGLARQMAHATYSDLKAFAYWRGCGCVADPDWTKINAFINVGYASWNPVDFVWEVSDAQLREKIGILGVPWRSPNGR
jgi:RHS repeat-associated protein